MTLPEPLRKLLVRVLLSPPIKWFIPAHHRHLIELPDRIERMEKEAAQQLGERLAKMSPEQIAALQQQSLNGYTEQARHRYGPWKH